MRLSATRSLFERRDCVIVASVSCIYGLGSPEAYYGMLLLLEKGQRISRKDILRRLVEILYERNDTDFRRGTFRVRGDVIEVFPTYDEAAYRIELFGDEIESLAQIDPLFGTVKQKYSRLPIYPKSHYVVQPERKSEAQAPFRESPCRPPRYRSRGNRERRHPGSCRLHGSRSCSKSHSPTTATSAENVSRAARGRRAECGQCRWSARAA